MYGDREGQNEQDREGGDEKQRNWKERGGVWKTKGSMWMICYAGTWKGTGTPQFQGDREAGENKDEGRGKQGRHQEEAEDYQHILPKMNRRIGDYMWI